MLPLASFHEGTCVEKDFIKVGFGGDTCLFHFTVVHFHRKRKRERERAFFRCCLRCQKNLRSSESISLKLQNENILHVISFTF